MLFSFYEKILRNRSLLQNTGVAILAGGDSSRMGSDKATLKFDDDHNFIQKIISEYHRAGIFEISIVTNVSNDNEIWDAVKNIDIGHIDIFCNDFKVAGRMFSVAMGIGRYFVEDFNCFVHNCDNPFITAEIILELIENFDEDHALIPAFKGAKGHPVFLPVRFLKEIALNNQKYKDLKSYLATIETKTIEVDNDCILRNINTRDEYRSFFPVNDDAF